MDIWKIISGIKDWFVKYNKGLHFSLAYIWFDLFYLINFYTAVISVFIFIILMEYIDKYKIKTKFSLIDITYGLLGALICYIKYLIIKG